MDGGQLVRQVLLDNKVVEVQLVQFVGRLVQVRHGLEQFEQVEVRVL